MCTSSHHQTADVTKYCRIKDVLGAWELDGSLILCYTEYTFRK